MVKKIGHQDARILIYVKPIHKSENQILKHHVSFIGFRQGKRGEESISVTSEPHSPINRLVVK
jgi:hypothetical protein